MALTLEWSKRVEVWKEELTRHYYTPLGSIGLEGFTTFEQLSAEEAEQGNSGRFPAEPGGALNGNTAGSGAGWCCRRKRRGSGLWPIWSRAAKATGC
ncbi:MAG: hypothetical protein K0Q90_396 [Paenibacillaceae bacterium]|jgi:hypothetical protein|nr:hypothetical protein [Paenibacillaceae bacterium]